MQITVDDVLNADWQITARDRYDEEAPGGGATTAELGDVTVAAPLAGDIASITMHWIIPRSGSLRWELLEVVAPDAFVVEPGDDLDYTLKEFLQDNYEEIVFSFPEQELLEGPHHPRRKEAMLQPNTVIQELEGVDVGSGALVLDVDERDDGVYVELFFLDSEQIETVKIDDDTAFVEEEGPLIDFDTTVYDPAAIDNECLHDIRTLPTYWGPRDPNNPSPLTDVMWRPEPYNQRWRHRYYDVKEHVAMSGDYQLWYALNRIKLVESVYASPVECIQQVVEKEAYERASDYGEVSEVDNGFAITYDFGEGKKEREWLIIGSPLRKSPHVRGLIPPSENYIHTTDCSGKLTEALHVGRIWGRWDKVPTVFNRDEAAREDENTIVREVNKELSAMIKYKGHRYAVWTPEDAESMEPPTKPKLPKRLRLDQWTGECEDLDDERLLDLTVKFLDGYESYRITVLPGRGDRKNLPLHDYALIFAPQEGLTDAGMSCLFQFMVETNAVASGDYQLWKDDIGSYEVYRRDRM